jgi:hypothetical protein
MTMGTRERLINGDEFDVFSRKTRHLGRTARSKEIKGRFWRRVRKLHRLDAEEAARQSRLVAGAREDD